MKVAMSTALSICSGKIFSNSIDEMLEFCESFTGHPVFDHDLVRIRQHVKYELIRQYPFLGEIDPSSINSNNVWDVLDSFVNHYGEDLEVTSMPSGLIPYLDPVETLKFIKPDLEEYNGENS